MYKECHSALGELKRDKVKMSKLRRWCFVSSLLVTYLTGPELRALWTVLTISTFSQSFRKLTGSVHDLLFHQRHAGVVLNVDKPVAGAADGVKTIVLSPRCQCPSMRSKPRRSDTAAYLRGTRGHEGRRAPVCVDGLRVKVPKWVAHSVYIKERLLAQEAFPVPRFVEVVRDQVTHVSLQGVSARLSCTSGPRGLQRGCH